MIGDTREMQSEVTAIGNASRGAYLKLRNDNSPISRSQEPYLWKYLKSRQTLKCGFFLRKIFELFYPQRFYMKYCMPKYTNTYTLLN